MRNGRVFVWKLSRKDDEMFVGWGKEEKEEDAGAGFFFISPLSFLLLLPASAIALKSAQCEKWDAHISISQTKII